MGTSEGHIIKEFMLKRSQMKGQMKPVNYKSRWFILTATLLRYHDGTLQTGAKNEKGRIALKDIIIVEEVNKNSLDVPGEAFQVVYLDGHSHLLCILYVITARSDIRDEWIKCVRKASETCGALFSKVFHPDMYNIRQGQFTCCYNIDRYSEGCLKTTTCPDEENPDDPVKENGTVKERNRALPPIPTPSTPAEATKKVVIAVYDYKTSEAGDMCLKKGEHYEIIDDSEPNWWLAISPSGEKGYVPSNYIEERSESCLKIYDWYYHGITRSQYDDILHKDGREGCFLVRDSRQQGMYAISLLTFTNKPEGSVHHYHIKVNKDNEYYLNKAHTFKTIPQLIAFHQRYNAGLCVRLQAIPSKSLARQPTTAGFGHGILEIDHVDLKLQEVIGKGQFGTVQKAIYKPRNQEVAVKMIIKGTMSEDTFIEEATVMKNLHHKNLVQLYGLTSSAPIYIIIEFMKNGSLQEYLRKNNKKLIHGPMQLDMCIQVSNAMFYLESKQYLHRDLAARNCLVGENNLIKVGDFGLARFANEGFYNASKGNFPVRWSAPEVLTFLHFTHKSDIWAFGVLMWEVYSFGKLPFGIKNNIEVIEHVKHVKPPLSKPDGCDDDVYEVMTTCWERNAEDRPSFDTMFESLKSLHPHGYVNN